MRDADSTERRSALLHCQCCGQPFRDRRYDHVLNCTSPAPEAPSDVTAEMVERGAIALAGLETREQFYAKLGPTHRAGFLADAYLAINAALREVPDDR